ncbi:MAG: hypothetical protein H6670_17975 [Anaerolineaceae bacterium]|nr:hypothetical protein [Anaerolineaceae bacterium]
MTTITIFEDGTATLLYHSDEKIVHHIFHRDVKGNTFRSVLNAGLDVFQEFKAYKWLSDDRMAGPLSHDDLEWARTDWFQRVAAEGWKYWALLLPRDVDSMQLSRETVHIWRPYGLKVMYFAVPNAAYLWLANQH